MSESSGVLPGGWNESELIGLVAHVMDYRGRTPKKLGMEWGGGEIPALSAKNVTAGAIDLNRETNYGSDALYRRWMTNGDTAKDDVLITLEAPLGNIACIPDDRKYILSQRVVLLRAAEHVRGGFLFHQLSGDAFQAELKRGSTGTTATGIQRAKLEKLVVRFPVTTSEQTRIAEILDTLDEAIREAEAVIAKLRQVKAGLLHDLLTRGLDEHGHLRDPIRYPDQFQNSPLGLIPKDWQVCLLGDVAEVSSGVTLGRDLKGSSLELPYLRVANVQDGYLDLSEMKTVRVLPSEVERFRLRNGDVLMNEGGDFDKLGRGAIWRGEIDPCLHQNHVFKVRPIPSKVLPEFLAAVSASHIGKSYFLVSSKQSTNLASINSTQLKSFPIPCPKIQEQELVATAIHDIEARLDAEQCSLNKLHRVKRGLSHDLLTGRKRVTT